MVQDACPDCGKFHAFVAAPPEARRVLARCTNCGRLWLPRELPPDHAVADRCAEHPERPVRWACESCGTAWCETCGRDARAPSLAGRLSPCCRAGCLPVAPLLANPPFWDEPASVLRYALRYALRGECLFMLVFLWFIGYLPVLSWFVLPLLVVYGFHVLRASSRDPHRAPGFPDPEDAITGLIYPLARLLGAGLLAWAPLLLYLRFAKGDALAAVTWPLALLGLVLLPAFVLPAAMGASLTETLDPFHVARTMRAMGGDYLAVVATLLVVALLWAGTRGLLSSGDAWVVLTEPVRIYAVLTAFHVLGRAILQTRDRVEWQL